MTASPDRARQVAHDLWAAGAIAVRPAEPFTWASGLRSPIYCDNRVTLSTPRIRSRITRFLAQVVAERDLQVDAVAGVATAGIPQATLLADRLALPLLYVRSSAKAHGRENRLEGRLERGWKVIVVEDLVSTGGSSIAVAEALEEAGAEVIAVLAVFSYGLRAAETAFVRAGVPLITLSTLDDLLTTGLDTGMIDRQQLESVERWRDDPDGWERG